MYTWDYGKGKHQARNNAIANFQLEKALSNINVHTQVKLINEILTNIYLGKTKLICWSTGPTDPILSKNKKTILQNCGQLAFFKSLIFCFLKKKRNKT